VLDLHAHTLASDGDLTPTALVGLAHAAGVHTLAVTDHDTMAGVPEAVEAGRRLGVTVVPGVELSVRVPTGSLHLLGYFPTEAPRPLLDRLEELVRRRAGRAQRILDRLAELGIHLRMEDVAALAAGPIGRPHIASALVAAGHCASRQEAFDRWLADGQPAHLPADGLGDTEAVRLVAESGGAPVLAHPASLNLSPRALESLVQRLAAAGLRGLEAYRPDHLPDRVQAYRDLARRHGLVATGGSDFHREEEGLRPGDTGDPPLPTEALGRLLTA
jgi:predicted metal-dependent phosphoesterase TrpH